MNTNDIQVGTLVTFSNVNGAQIFRVAERSGFRIGVCQIHRDNAAIEASDISLVRSVVTPGQCSHNAMKELVGKHRLNYELVRKDGGARISSYDAERDTWVESSKTMAYSVARSTITAHVAADAACDLLTQHRVKHDADWLHHRSEELMGAADERALVLLADARRIAA